MFTEPETRYVACGDSEIAYQVSGDGPDLIYVPSWFSHVELKWEHPQFAHCLRRLSSFARLISFDRRGVGASGPAPPEVLSDWELWVDDLEAVMEATGATRPFLFATADAGHMSMLFAATHPDTVAGLVLLHCAASLCRHPPEYPIGMTPDELDGFAAAIESGWGTGTLVDAFFPSHADDAQFRGWWARYQRASGTPRTAARMGRLAAARDIREVLGSVNCPTLVLHRKEFRFASVEHSRYLAEHITGAQLVELDGPDGTLYTGDSDTAIDAVEEWMTGTLHRRDVDEMFATVLFTDIVASTERARTVGDREWVHLLDSHNRIVADVVAGNGGRVVKSTGDGVLALFDRPTPAVVSACDIGAQLEPIGLRIRAGVHAGELTVRGADVIGIAVHTAARLMSRADAGQVLVSPIVRSLVDGSGLALSPAGSAELKGLEGQMELFAATARRTIMR